MAIFEYKLTSHHSNGKVSVGKDEWYSLAVLEAMMQLIVRALGKENVEFTIEAREKSIL